MFSLQCYEYDFLLLRFFLTNLTWNGRESPSPSPLQPRPRSLPHRHGFRTDGRSLPSALPRSRGSRRARGWTPRQAPTRKPCLRSSSPAAEERKHVFRSIKTQLLQLQQPCIHYTKLSLVSM